MILSLKLHVDNLHFLHIQRAKDGFPIFVRKGRVGVGGKLLKIFSKCLIAILLKTTG